MADLNKLRQVNPHWEPSFNLKKGYGDPVKEIMSQQIDEELEEGIKEMVDKHQEDLDKAGAEGSKKFWPITTHEFRPQEIEKIQKDLNKGYKDIADDLDLIESAKELITNKILKHFDDVLFEMVCQEMGDNYLFQSRNYLTEAGYELFEDEWFEFYHEHHGDILYRVKHGLFE